jgi:hypothetical protein
MSSAGFEPANRALYRGAADLRLKKHDHQDRPQLITVEQITA